MKPITLEIVTRVLTTFGHCRYCEVLFEEADMSRKVRQREMNDYPPDLVEEYARLSDWIRELKRLYKHRLLIRIIDAQSPLGIYKSLRYCIRKYPTFVVDGKETYTGWDKDRLEHLLDRRINLFLLSKQRRTQPSLT
jgi:hypothetical protein